MPRRKVSTLLDDHLYRRAKLEAIRQRKQVSEIVGEALEQYLTQAGHSQATTSVVAKGWGTIKIDRRTLARLMKDEPGVFDA